MSKAVLVLDEMPKCCAQCDLTFWAYDGNEWVCAPGDRHTRKALSEHNRHKRPSWCPLRNLHDLPERREVENTTVIMRDAEVANRSTLQQIGYNRGWNDCLDRLEGNNDE